MMYQLPIDMRARIASVTLATMSPPFHSASRPYGLSTSSVVLVAAAAGRRGHGLRSGRRCRFRTGRGRRGLPLRLRRERDQRGGRRKQQGRGKHGQAGHLQHVVSRNCCIQSKSWRLARLCENLLGSKGLDMSDSGIRRTVHPGPGVNTKTRWPCRGAGPSFRQKVAGFYTKASKSTTQKSMPPPE